MNISLKDIVPVDAEFTLTNGKKYRVRKFNLVDTNWLEQEFGEGADLEAALKNPVNMLRVAFHQMFTEDQVQFKAIDHTETSEDGEVTQTKIGGWRLFSQEVVGAHDAEVIGIAIMRAMLGSSPIVDEIAKAAVKSQEGAAAKPGKKKNSRAGDKSST